MQVSPTFGLFAIFCFILCACTSFGAPPELAHRPEGSAEQWLLQPPKDLEFSSEAPRNQYAEVTYSKHGAAISRLREYAAFPLNDQDVFYYLRRESFCSPGSKAYLVRAGFYQGGTGDYILRWSGTKNALLVGHGGLGPGEKLHKSALVVCLTTAPEAIYGWASTAL